MVHSMAWCGGTHDAIVIGIGYPDLENPQEMWLETMARRNPDFTPVRNEEREKDFGEWLKRPMHTGEAKHFHQFISDELIPSLERDYMTDPSQRILVGHSLAGEFAAFALFEAPDLFNAFVIGSCEASRNDQFIFKCEESFARDHGTLTSSRSLRNLLIFFPRAASTHHRKNCVQ